MCPDQLRAFTKTKKNQVFQKKWIDCFTSLSNKMVPGSPRHVCKRLRARVRISARVGPISSHIFTAQSWSCTEPQSNFNAPRQNTPVFRIHLQVHDVLTQILTFWTRFLAAPVDPFMKGDDFVLLSSGNLGFLKAQMSLKNNDHSSGEQKQKKGRSRVVRGLQNTFAKISPQSST